MGGRRWLGGRQVVDRRQTDVGGRQVARAGRAGRAGQPAAADGRSQGHGAGLSRAVGFVLGLSRFSVSGVHFLFFCFARLVTGDGAHSN